MSFARIITLTLLLAAALPAAPTYREALDLYKIQKYPEAKAAFQALVAAEPANPKYHYFLGVTAIKQRHYDEAIASLERATALAPTNSDYFAELGSAYGSAARSAGMFAQMSLAKKCRLALEKAVALNPDSLDARNGLVSFYRQAPGFVGGGMDKAYAQAEEIRRRDARRGAIVLAQLYSGEKRFDEAFAVTLELLQREPDLYIAHFTMGRLAAESGLRHDAGEKHLQRCLALTPDKGDPSHAAVHLRLGQIAEKHHNPASARSAYERALRLDPNFKPAADALAKLK